MMNNTEIEKQLKVAKGLASQVGISGVVYIDVDQTKGILRMKFKVTPAKEQRKLVTGMAFAMSQMSQIVGLQVNTREVKNEEMNNG